MTRNISLCCFESGSCLNCLFIVVQNKTSRILVKCYTPLGYQKHFSVFYISMLLQQFYEVPIAMKAVFGYIDTFSSRIREMEQQKRDGVMCKKEDKPRSLENFLSR